MKNFPVAPFNLAPCRSADGNDGFVLNGCDPRGNCNIPVCIFEESGGMFLHGLSRGEVAMLAGRVRRAMNNHDHLVEALRRAIQHVPQNAVSMDQIYSKPAKECRTLDFCETVLKQATS